jgi:hypothetical protein
MNAELFVPIYGSYRSAKDLHALAEDDSTPFAEKAAIAAGYGVMATPGVILMSETFGFTQGLVRATQITASVGPIAAPAAAVVSAGVVLNESTRKRIGSLYFTTPFTSGFGSVV